MTRSGEAISSGESARRGLIEQRLEEVEVAAIDQRHLDRRPAQPADSLQAAEAAAHDDDPMPPFGPAGA